LSYNPQFLTRHPDPSELEPFTNPDLILANGAAFRIGRAAAEALGIAFAAPCYGTNFGNGEICPIMSVDEMKDKDVVVVSAYPSGEKSVNIADEQAKELTRLAGDNGARRVTNILLNPKGQRKDRIDDGTAQPNIFRHELIDFHSAGSDTIISVDPHSEALYDYSPVPAFGINPLRIFADPLHELVDNDPERYFIALPDDGSARRAIGYDKELGIDMIALNKVREPNTREVRFLGLQDAIRTPEIAKKIKKKTAIVVDDMVDGGGTLSKLVQGLRNDGHGIKDAIVVMTYPVLSSGCYSLRDPLYRRIITTNAGLHGEDKRILGDVDHKLEIRKMHNLLVPLLAGALSCKYILTKGEVTLTA